MVETSLNRVPIGLVVNIIEGNKLSIRLTMGNFSDVREWNLTAEKQDPLPWEFGDWVEQMARKFFLSPVDYDFAIMLPEVNRSLTGKDREEAINLANFFRGIIGGFFKETLSLGDWPKMTEPAKVVAVI